MLITDQTEAEMELTSHEELLLELLDQAADYFFESQTGITPKENRMMMQNIENDSTKWN